MKFDMKMKLSLFVSLVMLAAGVSVNAADEAKPNFVYILMDDAGYGDLSCYGQEKFETPNIDALAAAGMKFTDHYSGSTVCAPTRCSLMSGLHTGHAFVRGNREVKPEGQAPIPADLLTIPEVLKEGGYRSGGFGKWGSGFRGRRGIRCIKGLMISLGTTARGKRTATIRSIFGTG